MFLHLDVGQLGVLYMLQLKNKIYCAFPSQSRQVILIIYTYVR